MTDHRLPHGGADYSKHHILIVDDVALIRGIVKNGLYGIGIGTVSSAQDGEQAYVMLRSGGVDLVICDWEMPSMNGLELLNRIRNHENPKVADMPFIMLTSSIHDNRVKEAISAGVDDYISKPLQIRRIQTSVHRLLQRQIAHPPTASEEHPPAEPDATES